MFEAADQRSYRLARAQVLAEHDSIRPTSGSGANRLDSDGHYREHQYREPESATGTPATESYCHDVGRADHRRDRAVYQHPAQDSVDAPQPMADDAAEQHHRNDGEDGREQILQVDRQPSRGPAR